MRNSSSCDAEQFHSDVNLKAVDRRTTNNSKNWQWKSEGDVSVRRSRPACMPVNDRNASSRQLAPRWSTATGIHSRLCQFVIVCCTVDFMEEKLYT